MFLDRDLPVSLPAQPSAPSGAPGGEFDDRAGKHQQGVEVDQFGEGDFLSDAMVNLGHCAATKDIESSPALCPMTGDFPSNATWSLWMSSFLYGGLLVFVVRRRPPFA